MARRSDPDRIETARRAAAIARLISAGWSTDGATALVAEWEELRRVAVGRPTRLDWESFEGWLRERPPGGRGTRSPAARTTGGAGGDPQEASGRHEV